MIARWLRAVAVAASLVFATPGATRAQEIWAYSGLFLPGGEAVVGWSDGALTETAASGTGTRQMHRMADGKGVRSLATTADGRRLAAASDGTVEVIELGAGRVLLRASLESAPKSLWFSPDGSLLLVRGDSRSALFDVAAGRRIAALAGGDDRMPGFVGGRALTEADNHLLIWSPDGSKTAEIDFSVFYGGVEVAPGRLLTGTHRGLRLVDVAAGRVVAEGDARPGPWRMIRLGPDRAGESGEGTNTESNSRDSAPLARLRLS